MHKTQDWAVVVFTVIRSTTVRSAMGLLAMALASNCLAESPESFSSRSGNYSVSYDSELKPPVINRIHSWTLFIEDAEGNPLVGAQLSMTGGMPIHNHGLPTDPRMTRELGDGRYLFEGVRFHMNGAWELTLTIVANGSRDIVVIPLTL